MAEEMIRLRFVTSNDLVSRVIRGATFGFPFSHVEAVTPDGFYYLGAHADGGVQNRPIDYDKGQWTSELFVDLPATDDQGKAFYAFLDKQCGELYDMDAIGMMAEGVVHSILGAEQSRGWICSGLITGGLLACGLVHSAPATVRLTTPRDVLMMCAALAAIGAPEDA